MEQDQQQPGVTEDQMATVVSTAVILNGISILCAVSVLIVYTFLRITRPALVNRTSLRLAVATAVADLLYAIAQIVSDLIAEDGTFCALSVWWYIQFTLLSVFLTAGVAINLQVVFLHARHNARSLEKWYYIVAVVLSTFIPAFAYFDGRFGWSELELTCWFKDDSELHSVLWQWAVIYIWLLLVILYCFGVIVAVLVRISRTTDNLDIVSGTTASGSRFSMMSVMSPPPSPSLSALGSPNTIDGMAPPTTPTTTKHLGKKRKRQNLIRILRRIILYPAIPIITQTPNLMVTMEAYILGYNTYGLVFLSFIATSIQGMLNCIIFFMDPAVKSGIADVRQERAQKRTASPVAVPKMVLTTVDNLEQPPTKAHSGSYAKKWRKRTETTTGESPTATIIGDTKDFLDVQIETGIWKFSNNDEEDWFKFL